MVKSWLQTLWTLILIKRKTVKGEGAHVFTVTYLGDWPTEHFAGRRGKKRITRCGEQTTAKPEMQRCFGYVIISGSF